EHYAAASSAHRERLANTVSEIRGRQPIAAEWVGAALAERLPEDSIVLDESVTSSDAVRRFLGREKPGSILSAGAPGLGWSLGAGLCGAGAQLPRVRRAGRRSGRAAGGNR